MKKNSAEFKQIQRERILRVKPWLKSTGAKTIKGKAISKMNALKTDIEIHLLMKKYQYLINQHKAVLNIVQR